MQLFYLTIIFSFYHVTNEFKILQYVLEITKNKVYLHLMFCILIFTKSD